jgi:hypothetical protein
MSEAAVSPGCLSERERNPDPEEVEAPLVVAGVPHRLLVEAEVVDRRRWRAPCGWQRAIPDRRRRCAPAPGWQSVTPRGIAESSAPVVVLLIPRWPPIVAVGTATGSAEVRRRSAGRTVTEVALRWALRRTAAEVALGTALRWALRRTASVRRWAAAIRRRATLAAAGTTLHHRRALSRRGIGDARAQADARRAEGTADRRTRDELIEFHYQAFHV